MKSEFQTNYWGLLFLSDGGNFWPVYLVLYFRPDGFLPVRAGARHARGWFDFDQEVLVSGRGLSYSPTNPAAHEPCTPIGPQIQISLELEGAHRLLFGTDPMNGQQPLVERDFRVFEDGAHRYAELFPALPALVKAHAPMDSSARFAIHFGSRGMQAAMRTQRTLGPELAFQIQPGRLFGLELRSRHGFYALYDTNAKNVGGKTASGTSALGGLTSRRLGSGDGCKVGTCA